MLYTIFIKETKPNDSNEIEVNLERHLPSGVARSEIATLRCASFTTKFVSQNQTTTQGLLRVLGVVAPNQRTNNNVGGAVIGLIMCQQLGQTEKMWRLENQVETTVTQVPEQLRLVIEGPPVNVALDFQLMLEIEVPDSEMD